jgi:hypothetical protein
VPSHPQAVEPTTIAISAKTVAYLAQLMRLLYCMRSYRRVWLTPIKAKARVDL